MMRLRAAAVPGVAALLLASSGAAGSPSADSRVLWQAPVLAGARVVWGEQAGDAGVVRLWTRGRGARVVYSSASLDLGRPLAASAELLAFQRSYPSCAPQPNLACPQAQDALAGPPVGPFKRLVPPRTCTTATGRALAVDAGVAAYVELDCRHDRVRVVVREVAHRGRPVIVRDASVSGGCCTSVALAGRYVAWDERGGVVVYDRLARRVAYRAPVGPAHAPGTELGFDLQHDGTLAVAFRVIEVARASQTNVAWFSPRAPREHLLRLHGRSTLVRIAGGRIAVERFLTAKTSALVVSDLAGRTQRVARFAPPIRLRGGFDFDGRRIVWAQDRVTATRVDCPPPGQGRPCVHLETGVTRVVLRSRIAGPSQLVARLPFVDTVSSPQY
jgi:hypothetical protein